MEDSSIQEFPTYVRRSSHNFNPFILFGSIFVIVLIGFAGYFFLGAKNKSVSASPLPDIVKQAMQQPTQAVVSEASSLAPSSPKNEKKELLDRSKITIAVLNGSGIAGAAKGTSSHLESLGYVIPSVANADEFTYDGLTVKVKKSKSDYLSLLKKDLTENASKVTITTKIDDTIETDAEVIVGK